MRPLRKAYASLPVADFGPLKLKAVRQAMIDEGHSRKYVNDNVNRIKRLIKWAVDNEVAPPSVFDGLQAVAGLKRGRSQARETDPIKPVPEAHVAAIRPFVSRQVAAMIDLQMLTGMRPGEVTIMRTGDIDVAGPLWVFRPSSH
jgi:integrase